MDLEKIVIIGSSGAGKTTFAMALGLILKMKVFHLDRLFWQRGWKRKTWHKRKEILEKAVFGEVQWIVDGNYLGSYELHLEASDTIIFLDLSPLLCLSHIIKRHFMVEIPRNDIPEGCVDKLTLRRLLKVMIFPLYGRKTIEQTLANYSSSKCIIRLCSKKEIKDFLAQQKYMTHHSSAWRSKNILSH
jgi:adenylate kinase family enzyme